MAITLRQIIDEANTIVPNEFSTAMAVMWINNINSDFFNIVKIPKIARFATKKGQAVYTFSSEVQQRNIDLVQTGLIQYRNMDEESVTPLQTYYYFDDIAHQLTLNPAPYQDGLNGILRYHRVATTIYTSSNLNAVPDAPEAFQWTYVPALCEYICLAMDDSKAANFNAQVTQAWNTAAQNYQTGGVAS